MSTGRMRNVTVSAWNSSDWITFTPQNCNGSGWSVTSKSGSSGYYISCTADKTPSVRFPFQGSAVYYVSSYFDNQTIEIVLDSQYTKDVNLTAPRGTPVSNASTVLWSMDGLMDTGHTLEIFPAQGMTLNVDTIIYTINDTASSTVSVPLKTSATNPSTSTSSTIHHADKVGLLIGTIAGSLSSLVLLGLFLTMYYRRRQLNTMRRSRTPTPSDWSKRQDKASRQVLSSHTAPVAKSTEPIRKSTITQQVTSYAPWHTHESPGSSEDHEKSLWYSDTLDHQRESRGLSQFKHHAKLEPLRKATRI